MGIYRMSSVGDRLYQGEILTGLVETRLKLEKLRNGALEAELVDRPVAVVLTQECDLESDYEERGAPETERRSERALLCEVYLVDDFRRAQTEGKSDLWKVVRQNKNERFQYLREIKPEDDLTGKGLGPLVLDFKSVFTVPLDELYWRIDSNAEVQRRVCLEFVYRDHLASRFHYFHQRVGLPEEHFLKPPHPH